MKQYMLPIVVDEDILDELTTYSDDRVLFMDEPQELSKSESEQLQQLNYKMIFKVKIKNVREESKK